MKISAELTNRFLDKVEENENGCWLWMAGLFGDGYGAFFINGKTHRAHRVSYSLFVDDITEGMNVLHKCHVRRCVNPSHLREGTQAENIQDMFAAGRNPPQSGESNPSARLTMEVINNIREISCMRTHTQIEIAKMFDVDQSTISRILANRTWIKETI